MVLISLLNSQAILEHDVIRLNTNKQLVFRVFVWHNRLLIYEAHKYLAG